MKRLGHLEPVGLEPLERLTPIYGGDETEDFGDVSEYEKVACKAAGVPFHKNVGDGVYHFLGYFEVRDSDEAVDAVVRLFKAKGIRNIYSYREYIDASQRRTRIEGDLKRARDWLKKEEIVDAEHVYKYDEWLDKDDEKKGAPPLKRESVPPELPPERDIDFVRIFHIDWHSQDRSGYLAYIKHMSPSLYNKILKTSLPLLLKEDVEKPNAYILGTVGIGKSELLKILVHTYVTNPHFGSVVVLDPTSELVREVAHWKEFQTSNRLVYVCPTLAIGKAPVLNPFEIFDIDADDYSRETEAVKGVVAQELVGAIGRIVSDESVSGSLTTPMKAVLRNCIPVLLDKPGATLIDLLHFMNDSTNSELIGFAEALVHHERIADYFKNRFKNPGNKITKEAIQRKLDGLLSIGAFKNMTCGKSTIFLEKEIDAKKVVLFDLGKGAIGVDEGRALGRLIIGMLLGIAFRRDPQLKKERVPCSIIVDECHNFATESMEDILTETRKYRMMLTLSQQFSGQRLSPALRDAIMQTTNLQIVGGTPRSGAARNGDLLGVSAEEVRRLDTGEFYVRGSRRGSIIKFRTRKELLGYRNSVSAPTWRRMKKKQIKLYYEKKEEPDTKEEWTDDKTDRASEWSR